MEKGDEQNKKSYSSDCFMARHWSSCIKVAHLSSWERLRLKVSVKCLWQVFHLYALQKEVALTDDLKVTDFPEEIWIMFFSHMHMKREWGQAVLHSFHGSSL